MTSDDTQLVQTEPGTESIEDGPTPIDRQKAQQGVRLLLEAMGEEPD
jgi:hypothetical protein